MHRIRFIIIVFCYFQCPVFAQLASYKVIPDQEMELSDGTLLAHDLYLPVTGSSHPSILIRTPYGKEGSSVFAVHFATHGFAVVVQDVRGKGASKGVFTPFVNEKKDGYETLDWMNHQKWSNHRIGLWGSSYLSFCALSLADSGHPALKGIFNLSGWIDGSKVNYPGGAFHQMLIIPWLLSDGQTSLLSEAGADLDEMFAHTPLKEAIPGGGALFKRSDGSKISLTELAAPFNYSNVDVPIFHMNGWYDFTTPSTLDAYTALNVHSKSKQHLVLGPWYHNQIYDEYFELGDYQIPNVGQMTIPAFLAKVTYWFDYTLNQKALDMGMEGNIRYYVLFLDQWKSAKQWPPQNRISPFYLNDGNELSLSIPQELDASSTFEYDPSTPTPTLGGANFFLFSDKIGIKNQQQIEERKDVLLFTTPVFEEDNIIAGDISVDLFVETTGKSADFTAKLTLVDKSGVSRNIIDGIQRISPKALQAGVNSISIELGAIAFSVSKGERLRLQISGSNYPKFNRNPSTEVEPLKALILKKAQQTVYHSKRYPSKINIPFLKN
ncbi:CocE/NonD family hydrolase [Spongiimicrobium salis]|uniref:CocE/NonD family hydrolase n=1 Tax=Spongiimicrobium salis TaxID=1667022 RepID=UPI00374C8D3C